MKDKLLILLVVMMCCGICNAQSRKQKSSVKSQTVSIAQAYADSLAIYKAKLDSINAVNDSLEMLVEQTEDSYRLFAPLVYDKLITDKGMSGRSTGSSNSELDAMLLGLFLNRPDLVRTTVTKLHESASQGSVVPITPVRRELPVVTEAPVVDEVPMEEQVNLVVTKPNFWKFSGDYHLHFMQNHLSDNWYQGGESNFSLFGSVILQMNYDDKEKWLWNNKLEMKLGFQTSESDTVHHIKANSDLLRYTGMVGLHASKKWYYTLQALATTQFAYGLKSNDPTVYSDILSPLVLNLSLGMDYNLESKNKKLTGLLHVAPFSYNMKYIDRTTDAVLQKNGFDLNDRKHFMHDFGFQMTFNMIWKPSDSFKWETRLYSFWAYTTQHDIVVEWENTLTAKINKYISTILYLYPRFDNALKVKEGQSKIQFKEYLSLGFTYSL